MRLLFFGEAVTLAHVARPLLLANAAAQAGHEVHMAAAPRFDLCYENSTVQRWPLASIEPAQFMERLSQGRRLYDQDTLSAYVQADLKTIASVKPDLVVGDFRLSLAVSTTLADVPYANIINAHWSPYLILKHWPVPETPVIRFIGVATTEWAFNRIRHWIFSAHARPLNALRKQHGLAPYSDLREVYCQGDHVLYPDTPTLIPTHKLPSSHRYLGPLVWEPQLPEPDWLKEVDGKRPLIYLTLGSSGQLSVLPDFFEALGKMSVTVAFATAGRIEPHRLPSNFRSANFLPGSLVAARAALVICNGGSATVYQALAQGTPVLGVASNLDQFLTMAHVEQAHAGWLMRPEKIHSQMLQARIQEMLADTATQQAAQELATDFNRYSALERFKTFLAELA